MTKIRILYDIFEKKNGSFTDDAKLSQSIIKFLYENHNKAQKLQQIINWAVNNVELFTKRSESDSRKKKEPIKSKAHRHHERIESRINDLLGLNLVRISGKSQGQTIKDLEVDLYSLTKGGHVIRWMLERRSCLTEKKYIPNDKLFELIQQLLKEYNSSVPMYLSTLYSFYKKYDIFDKALDFLEDVLSTDLRVKDVINSIARVITKDPIDAELRKSFWLAFQKTMDEVATDEHLRQMLFFYIKDGYEADIMHNFPDREWEDMWIALKSDYTRVVLYMKCHKCNEKYPLWVSTLDLIKHLTPTGSNLSTECRKCKMELSIP